MTRDELLEKLTDLEYPGDTEENHIMADEALLNYIDDEDIEEAYRDIDKWYA